MMRAPKVSRPVWVLLAASALLCAAVWLVSHRVRPVRWAGNAELVALSAERDQLRDNDDPAREALRARQQTRLQEGWTTLRLAGLSEKLGPNWRCDWQPDRAGERPVVVTRVAPGINDWPTCLLTVRQWAATPGVRLDSLDMVADGVGHQRRFTRIALGLRFILAAAPTGNAKRAAPGRGPLPVAPAIAPATTRKVGPGPSLVRPSASAEPPATGPASAPFRPDPPGVRAGEFSPSPVHQPIGKQP